MAAQRYPGMPPVRFDAGLAELHVFISVGDDDASAPAFTPREGS